MQKALRAKLSNKNIPIRIELLATPERARQEGGVVLDYYAVAPNSRVLAVRSKARCECKLDGYFLFGKIAKDEHAAGIMFREAWQSFEGIKTRDSTVQTFGTGDGSNAIDRLIAGERRLKEAHTALRHKQWDVVVSVCGENEPAGGSKRLATLRRGLDALSRLWGC